MRFVIFVAVLFTFSSCNFLKIVDRKQEKRYHREGMALRVFQDGNIKRAVHYSNNNKPKVMLVHGYGASGIGQYYRSGIELNERYDVILPDLLYCGKSTGNGSDYSIEAQVEHLRIILDSIEITEPVVLIGNSYGGIISSYFAEKYPEKVKKLVVYDSPINFYTTQYADSLAKTMGVESVDRLLAPTDIPENRRSLDIVFYDQPYIPRFLRRQMVKYGSLPAREVQLHLIDHLKAREVELNDHHFDWKMPVYLCWGEFDALIPMSTCRKIQQRYAIPEERVKIFPKAAHAANVEHPDAFVNYVDSLMK